MSAPTRIALFLLLFASTATVTVHAQTNSWLILGDGAWQDAGNWSLHLSPTNSQTVSVLNPSSKTVTIDAVTSGARADTMTVSNLLLSAPAGATNTLNLSGAGTNVPLVILDTAMISAGGQLRLSDSSVWGVGVVTNANTNAIPPVVNRGFGVDGTLELDADGVLAADCGVYVGTATNATGLVWVNGGQLLLTNQASGIGIVGSGQLIASGGTVQPSGFMLVGVDAGSQGALTIDNGAIFSASFLSRLSIGMETGAVGAVIINSGSLIMTNSLLTLVAGDGSGLLNFSGGTNILGPVDVGGDAGSQGTMTIAGGVTTLRHALFVGDSVGSTGVVWLTGGQLVTTNFSVCLGRWGYATATVSNGSWTANKVLLGTHAIVGATNIVGVQSQGVLNIPGGSMTVLTDLVVGNCTSGGIGVVKIAGGSLYVTNANHNAVLEVRSGTVTFSGGAVVVDKLVLTNTCGQFVHSGGALSITSTNLDPNLSAAGDGIANGWKAQFGFDVFDPTVAGADPDGDGFTNLQEYFASTDPTNSDSSLRVLALVPQGNNISIVWACVTGRTYLVQSAGIAGVNNFSNLGTVTIPISPVITQTNYVDVGASTNAPSKLYRIQLVTP